MVKTPTPGKSTCADVAELLGVPQSRTAKAVFLAAEMQDGEEKLLFAVVRGERWKHAKAVWPVLLVAGGLVLVRATGGAVLDQPLDGGCVHLGGLQTMEIGLGGVRCEPPL